MITLFITMAYKVAILMKNIFGPNDDEITVLLKIVVAIMLLLSFLLPLWSALKKVIKEKTLLVTMDVFGQLSPYFCFAGAILAYSLLVAYENPKMALQTMLLGGACIIGIAGVIVVNLLIIKSLNAPLFDDALRTMKLKK